jgi:hypothetical protein
LLRLSLQATGDKRRPISHLYRSGAAMAFATALSR